MEGSLAPSASAVDPASKTTRWPPPVQAHSSLNEVRREVNDGNEQRCGLHGTGQGRSEIDRIPEAQDAGQRDESVWRKGRPAWRHPEGHNNQHLWIRSTHGAWQNNRSGGIDPGP